jgi:hypothetical protein|tara:strand:+ start:5437 stop:6876 length:1440 start_codon:yes stop_codon:yes gene_type:complete
MAANGSFTGSAGALAHLTPRPTQTLFNDNYLSLTDMDFTQQFLPEVYEKEVERFGNRTISGFLRMVGAEMPMASDQVVWSEQGRLHIAYDNATITTTTALTIPANAGVSTNLIGPGATIVIASADGFTVDKAYVQSVTTAAGVATITFACYGATQTTAITGSGNVKVFVYGSEYAKGTQNAGTSVDAAFEQFNNKPIILRDKYSVNGSDTAQIGWVEVTTEAGTSGYLWYLKSEHEARIRFEDQLEMSMIEAERTAAGTTITPGSGFGGGTAITGSDGLFSALEERGLVYTDADFDGATGLDDFDLILQELDKQGSIEENMLFLDRATSLGIDNMLAAQNSYGAGGTSYGVFENSEDMALNLGFSGFRRGSYDFYKTDWKYLNDATTRGLVGDVQGVLVPAGTSSVYDQMLGQNISRPFLHIRYRASEADDRKMKSWITGSVGGNFTSDEDAMNVHFLSERCLCVQAANNFILFKDLAS